MPFDEIGINLKSSYAVLYMMDSNKIPSAGKPTSTLYKNLDKWTRMNYTEEQWNECNKNKKINRPPVNHLQKNLSQKSQTRVKNAVNLLLECSTRKKVYSKKDKRAFSFKVGFMTMTIPFDCKFDDHTIHYKIFRPFIRRLQEQYNLSEYLWKAETQDNNQLHYHLTLNVFIHWKVINEEWNQQLKKNSYVFNSVDSERASTDIHATKSIKNLGGYLCGYVAKKDLYKNKGREFIKKNYNLKNDVTNLPDGWFIEGGEYKKRVPDIKLWDCSENLKKEKLTFKNCLSQHKNIITSLAEIAEREIQFDYYSIILFDRKKMKTHPHIGALFDDYIQRIKYKNRQQEEYYVESLEGNFTLN